MYVLGQLGSILNIKLSSAIVKNISLSSVLIFGCITVASAVNRNMSSSNSSSSLSIYAISFEFLTQLGIWSISCLKHMFTHLLMKWKGIPTTATTCLHGGGFTFLLCNLGILHAIGILVSRSILLLM